MIGASSRLVEVYGSAMGAYLAQGGEAARKRAYDLGRRAVNEGVGLLEMVLLHQRFITSFIQRTRPPARPEVFHRAMEFLAECLAPFEMALRGFQDAYARLRELNEKHEALVSDRMRELRNAEVKYLAHVERIPAITYIESIKTGDTVYISPQIETLSGFTQQEWLQDPGRWARQLHPDDRDRILSEMSRFREGAATFRSHYRLLTREGREAWVRHDATLVRDDSGRPQFIQGILLDATEQTRIEELKNGLLSLVGHDRNSALSTVRELLGLIASDVHEGVPERIRLAAETAHRNCERLERLVKDLLDQKNGKPPAPPPQG